MTEQKHNNWWKFFYSRWFLLVVFILAIFVAVAFFRSYYQNYLVQVEISRLQDEVRKLEGDKIKMMEILKYAQSPEFAEQKARTEFNLVKPGEQVAIINIPGEIKSGQNKDQMIKWNKLSNVVKWWQLFMGK